MMKTIIEKIIVIIILIIQISLIFGNFNISKAVISENETILIQGDHECDSLLEYWMEDYQKWSYKIVWYVYYLDKETNIKYPAFCVQPEKEGVGTGYEEYDATVTKEKDNIIWRILNNGYMGKTYTNWNLECDDDLYSATKIALHSYAQNIAPVDKYIIGTRSVDGNTIEDIQRRGAKVLDVAQKLYEYGINGKDKYEEPQANIKQEDYKIENINGKNYYTKKYEIATNKELKSYEIELNNFPLETVILNSNNELISGNSILDSNNELISANSTLDSNNELILKANNYKLNQKNFKLAIPTDKIITNINGTININNILIKTNPIYYCNSSIANAQNYVTYTNEYESLNKSLNLHIEENNCNLKIKKIDEETKESIENVTFEIKNENNELIGIYKTNENGEINIEKISQGIIKVKEIETLDNYKMNSDEKEVKLEWGKTSYIEIENKRIKGQIKIVKTSEDDNEITNEKAGIPLKNVSFEIYDENKNIVDSIITDEEGIAISKQLEKGKYIIKEINTNENYILSNDEIEVDIKEYNEIITVDIKNKSKTIEKIPEEPEEPAKVEEVKEPVQKLPRTGF